MKRAAIFVLLAFLSALPAFAEGVRNGNEFALNYARADKPGQAAFRKDFENTLLTFRFLKITAIETNVPPGALPVYTTVEPSSEYTVILRPQGGVSRQITAGLAVNDCVTANGRLAPIASANTFVIDPAVIRSKDRAAPKGEKELLPEIDSTAVK